MRNVSGSGPGLSTGWIHFTGIGFAMPALCCKRCLGVIRSAWSLGRSSRVAGAIVATGASRSSWPRSTRAIAVVAVAIFVIENHGAARSGPIGVLAGMSARPVPARARTPSGPTITSETPGT